MRRLQLRTALLVCATSLSSAVSAQDNPSRQMILSITLYEQGVNDARPKILAEPAIATIPGRPFSFEAGGAVKAAATGALLRVGTRATGTLERTAPGSLKLALKISLASAVPQQLDPPTDLVRTQTLEIHTELWPGQPKRLNCSASQWCVVAVEPVQ